MIQVGRVCEIVRYPVKSMAGMAMESALLAYASVVRSGPIRVGDRVSLVPEVPAVR